MMTGKPSQVAPVVRCFRASLVSSLETGHIERVSAMNATTPICRSCGRKFPGRDTCSYCGCDPHADPSSERLVEIAVGSLASTGDRELDRRRRRALERSMRQSRKPRQHGRR